MAAQPVNGAGGAPVPEMHLRVRQALEVVHSSYSTNDARREAQNFLEEFKAFKEAPLEGYNLAADKSQPPVVRHYALSILEHAIKHKWMSYGPDEAAYLRRWVLELCQAVSKDDPSYLRNKTAQLWVDVAKRSWVAEWMDMDTLLVQLWQIEDSAAHKELVMFVLETLSDEVFNGDDPIVAMREGALSKACVEIFTPSAVLAEAFPKRQPGPEVRYGDEGWLVRISRFLEQCLGADVQNNEPVRICAIKALQVFYSLMPWAIPKAVAAASCVPIMLRGLATPNLAVQKASLEALHALYCRTNFNDGEFRDLVAPMYQTETVDLCRRLAEWSTVDAQDIDDERYQFGKKFSEMLSCLGNYIDRKYSVANESADFNAFLHLLLQVVQNQSLIVSIPVLVTWHRLLSNRFIGPRSVESDLIGPLLDVCCSRQIRYENLPQDSEDATYLFLMEDTDTMPERHAFVGNYRRYSANVIETVVQLKVSQVFSHLLGQTEEVLRHLYDGEPPLEARTYLKHSMPVLKVDRQCTVIEAALKGYVKWRAGRPRSSEDAERTELEAKLEQWCKGLLDMTFEDPQIRKRVLQLLVGFSTTALDKNANFMLKVLEHILMTWPTLHAEHRAYNEAIKDLQSESMVELQRLAVKMPDHLLEVYSSLEAKVNEMISSGALDDKRSVAYQSFLFIILHRTSRLGVEEKVQRLRQFVEPIKAAWQSAELGSAIASYDGFCQLLSLDKAQRYLTSHRVHEIKDWGACDLDAEGLALQAELEDRLKVLPLRMTKSFLAFSVERVEKSWPAFEASMALWGDSITIILPHLLQLLSHAHASHNAENWVGLPADMKSVVGRTLSDRFWQAGISEGSKDDFYARVIEKKTTVEGLGSTIRGSFRFVRDSCYALIYCLSRLDTQFYGFDALPEPLSRALLADAYYLSTHQQTNILNLVRYLVDDCPVERREMFLPPLLTTCFQQMDRKINSEWEKLSTIQTVTTDGDDLTEEMKAESILRQVTYTAVVMVADFLDPMKKNAAPKNADSGNPTKYPTLRKFCLMHTGIVEPLLIFCTHAIRMRDTRCCSIILRVFRSIIPEFIVDDRPQSSHGMPPPPEAPGQAPNQTPGHARHHSHGQEHPEDIFLDTSPLPADVIPPVREYVSSNVLEACVTSLHEPYFVDLQKELATLIANILVYYSPFTETPSKLLLSLPGITQADLERFQPYMSRPQSNMRQQRSLVLELLKDLKGVSISEQGKLNSTAGAERHSHGRRPHRSKMAQAFMTGPDEKGPQNGEMAPAAQGQGQAQGQAQGQDESLEGLAALFDS